MIYKFRQPHRCQNGHFNYLYFELYGDKLVNHKWGENKCKCPKFNIGDGYRPIDGSEMHIGQHDKNGNEIYQKDIVHLSSKDGIDYNALIIFKNSGFCAIDGTEGNYSMRRYGLSRCDLEIEVIGNIHENPKLLEDVK